MTTSKPISLHCLLLWFSYPPAVQLGEKTASRLSQTAAHQRDPPKTHNYKQGRISKRVIFLFTCERKDLKSSCHFIYCSNLNHAYIVLTVTCGKLLLAAQWSDIHMTTWLCWPLFLWHCWDHLCFKTEYLIGSKLNVFFLLRISRNLCFVFIHTGHC